MTSNRPYLIRAIYEWIADNQLTPYIIVDTTIPGVIVPQDYVNDDQIILNIAFHVVSNLTLSNDEIYFDARFKGISQHICVPVKAVKAIYAKENGKGMGFDPEDDDAGTPANASKGRNSSHLRIVK